ncbi:unnamed protein product [Blepharisma stoltei]|uniref:PH domain-containing protein n=1 Tax=Blepharisma stoltei TaxID=1481888 RepID=A0AAU9IW04_9CILI|nr:unnamed protein product [Blepharisma stoltei]
MEFQNQQPASEETPKLVQGYLKKLKNDRALIRFVSKFTKRWFVLDIAASKFYYCKNSTKPIPIKHHSLNEITNFVRDLDNIELSDWRFSFKVETTSKIYTLYCENSTEYEKWCEAFQNVVNSVKNNRFSNEEINERKSYEPEGKLVASSKVSCSIDFTDRNRLEDRSKKNVNPLLRKSYKENEEPWTFWTENSKTGLLSGAEKRKSLSQAIQRSDEILIEDISNGNQTPSFPLNNVENMPRQRSTSIWDNPANKRFAEFSTKPPELNWC